MYIFLSDNDYKFVLILRQIITLIDLNKNFHYNLIALLRSTTYFWKLQFASSCNQNFFQKNQKIIRKKKIFLKNCAWQFFLQFLLFIHFPEISIIDDV